MKVRVNQELNVTREGGVCGLCFSPSLPLQSLGMSQELRLGNSDSFEVALDHIQLLLCIALKLLKHVVVPVDGLHIETSSV